MAVSGIPTHVLVAPDSFKGTLAATEVAAAIGRGFEEGGWPVDRCPVADGGEGTLAALAQPLGLRLVRAATSDPLGRPIEAEFGVGAIEGMPVALVETAAASGLSLLAVDERDALGATTYGTGRLIAAAVQAGAHLVLVAVGGSATTDGGRGAIEAIEEAGGLGGARLTILCDVQTPFEEAARVFAPQKGATPEQVETLTRRLDRLARGWEPDPRGRPMTGAAGGLSGGLWSAFGASLVPGAAFVLEAVGFDPRMRAARAVVTGEGRLDRQSLVGKAVGEVATRARQAGVPCHAIVGRCDLDRFELRILDLQVVLEAGTLEELELAGRELAGRL